MPDDWALEIKKKPIRHFYFRVLPVQKKIVISCPVTADSGVVDQAILSKAAWIRRQVHLARARPVKPVFSYVTGEIHFYKGSPCSLKLTPASGSPRVFLSEQNTLILSVKPGTGLEKRKALLEDWYRHRLLETAGRLVKKWEPLAEVVVHQVRVKKMKTRWGSCNIQAARIWLNLELAHLDPVFTEYVLVHEMVHLLEKYHNHKFYDHMDRLIPLWPDVKNRLNLVNAF